MRASEKAPQEMRVRLRPPQGDQDYLYIRIEHVCGEGRLTEVLDAPVCTNREAARLVEATLNIMAAVLREVDAR